VTPATPFSNSHACRKPDEQDSEQYPELRPRDLAPDTSMLTRFAANAAPMRRMNARSACEISTIASQCGP